MKGLKIQKTYVFLALAIVIIATCGCLSDDNTETGVSGNNEQITVAVSILPQQEFVEKIGGDKVKAVLMIPPGASPATYEPTTGQLQEISNAQMYAIVGSGLPFETAWLEKIRDVNEDMIIVDCSKDIQLRQMEEHVHEEEEHEEGGHTHEGSDPHIWTTPVNAEIMINNIYDALVKIDPDNKDYYKENKDSYFAELDELDNNIRTSLEGQEGSYIMVFHPAWGYFTDEYGLRMLPIEIEGKEPSASELSQIIDEAKEHEIKVIFVQSQFSTQSAEALAGEINGEVVQVDPLAKDYIDNLNNVTAAFRAAIQ